MNLLIWKLQGLVATIIAMGAAFMSVMVEPITTWGHRHISTDFPLWISKAIIKTCLFIAILLVMASGAIIWCGLAQAAEKEADNQITPSGSPMTFEESVKIAIHRSPYFTKSSLQIDIRRMDETDSRYGMIPPLTFRTVYYANRPDNPGMSPKPYSLSFSTDPYNPFGAYFTLQAQKVATQIAILTHLKSISKGLERMGQYYLELDFFKKNAAFQRELVKLDREHLTYAENRVSIGTGTSLEAKVANQELHLSQGELDQIAMIEKRQVGALKNMMGLSSTAEFKPELRDSRRQVLGNFDPATTTVEQIKARSHEIKVVELHKKLQDFKVFIAKAKILPNILFNTQTPDPLSATSNYGLYVGFGLEIPVWDGFKRFRDISRQKALSKQVDAEKAEKESYLEDTWHVGLDDLHQRTVALKIAQSKEELARLKAQQIEVRYQSGEVNLPAALDSRKQVIVAQKDTLKKILDCDEAVLKLREISGDLGNTYVDPNSWQK